MEQSDLAPLVHGVDRDRNSSHRRFKEIDRNKGSIELSNLSLATGYVISD